MHSLAREQSRSSPGSVACVLMNKGRLADELSQEGIPVTVLEEAHRTTSSLVAGIAEVQRHGKYELLHSHRQKEHVVAALAARRCKTAAGRAALVATVHGLPENSKSKQRLRRVLVNAAQQSALRYGFDAIVGVSEDIANRLRPRYPRTDVVCIHNGIDLEPFTQRDVPKRHASPNLRLTAIGRLVAIKRYDRLREIANRVTQLKGSSPSITLAGDGPLRDDLRSLLQADRPGCGVNMPGFVVDTVGLLRRSDALLITSDHEGIPMIALEALAAGIPVFAFATGGLPEIAASGVNMHLARLADLSEMAGQIVSYFAKQDFSTGATLPANWSFDVRQCAASYAEVYERAIARVRARK